MKASIRSIQVSLWLMDIVVIWWLVHIIGTVEAYKKDYMLFPELTLNFQKFMNQVLLLDKVYLLLVVPVEVVVMLATTRKRLTFYCCVLLVAKQLLVVLKVVFTFYVFHEDWKEQLLAYDIIDYYKLQGEPLPDQLYLYDNAINAQYINLLFVNALIMVGNYLAFILATNKSSQQVQILWNQENENKVIQIEEPTIV